MFKNTISYRRTICTVQSRKQPTLVLCKNKSDVTSHSPSELAMDRQTISPDYLICQYAVSISTPCLHRRREPLPDCNGRPQYRCSPSKIDAPQNTSSKCPNNACTSVFMSLLDVYLLVNLSTKLFRFTSQLFGQFMHVGLM